ncbi:MAG: Uma2 family endonuclease [Pirellulales bacterium]
MSTSTKTTVAEYDRMIERGEFEPVEQHHVELIRGEICEMSPIYPPHEDALDLLVEWSFAVCPGQGIRVRVQNSLGIPELESVPQPDLAWVRRIDYRRVRPTVADLLLLVEVSDTSLRFDRGKKARLYAEAGVQDYWIANVKAEAIEVHRTPRDGVYIDVQSFKGDQAISPLALPTAKLTADQIWPQDVTDPLA